MNRTSFPSTEFGVEQEHFVLDSGGCQPTPQAIEELWRELASARRGKLIVKNGDVLGLRFGSPAGAVEVTNDACTHVVEVAFPPIRSLIDFAELYETTWDLLSDTMNRLGLKLILGGSLESLTGEIFWRSPVQTGGERRLRELLNRPQSDNPLFNRNMPAYFAASQVSLSMSPEDACKHLRGLYSFEFLVPQFFSTSPKFGDLQIPCVRPVVIEANLAGYVDLVNIPREIPASWDEYRLRRNENRIRDYSSLAVREPNRVEFRSACSQSSLSQLVSLVRLRQAIYSAVQSGCCGSWNPREAFFAACHGHPTPAREAIDLLTPSLAQGSEDLLCDLTQQLGKQEVESDLDFAIHIQQQ